MITLAGHGKDDRLIQVEIPIVPSVGDRIREDCNNKGLPQLKSLITEGEFIESVEKYGTKYWKVSLDNGKVTNFNPEDCQIIERAAAPVNQSLLEQTFKIGDQVYQENPDNTGVITKISRGKALVNVGCDRTVIVPLGRLHHCDPNYLPKAKKSQEEILAEEEAAIAKARDEYLKSQPIAESHGFKVGDRVIGRSCTKSSYREEVFAIGEIKRFYESPNPKDHNLYANIQIGDQPNVVYVPSLENCEIQSDYLVFKVGDRIRDKDGFEGVINDLDHNHLSIKSPDNIKCFNLKLCKEPLHKLISHISTGLEALELSAMQPESPAKLKQSDTLTSAKMLKPSTVQTSLKSQSLETLEKSPHQQELISTQGDSPAQEPPTQEPKQDSYIQSLLSGLNISELSTKDDPDSLSSKTQLQLLVTHCEQYLEDSEWSDIVGTIHRSYKLLSSEVPKNGSDCLSLPTLTTNKGVKSRSSGQSRCEKWFRDKGLLLDTQCLSPQMMAVLFGFPMEWTKCLWDVQGVQTGELDLDICLEEPSTLTAVQQSLNESCISIAVSTVDIDEANLGNSDHAIATKTSESVAISRIDDVLVESNVRALDERLAYLQSERDRLIASGASPQGVWICCSRCHDRDFRQAVWKSDKPQRQWGGKKSQYIGRQQGDEHLSAIAQHRAGQELRKIEREIRKLQDKKS
jgi:hypothetical protein